jgi:biopolymer transport protein ExbB
MMHDIFIGALLLTSIISVTFMVERGLALRWIKVIPPDVSAGVMNFRSQADLDRLKWTCDANPSPLSNLLSVAAAHLDWSREENSDILETRARQEISRLERGLVVLEIIVGIAPLLGLVGTIYGLILLFGSMNDLSAGETAGFSAGISLALKATLLGLCIAIPTLVAWSYYSKKVENLSVEMESLSDEFLRKCYHAERVRNAQAQAAALADATAANPAAAPEPKADPSPAVADPAMEQPDAAQVVSTPRPKPKSSRVGRPPRRSAQG